MKPVTWGIVGTARIGVDKVIPAMRRSPLCNISAIASRDAATARRVADRLGIPKAYGSYEELLADGDIEAIYNPLPNHLHVSVSTLAAEAGKHVLCEKPIAMNAAEAEQLIAVRERTGVLMQEAFMVRHHPQWRRVRQLVNAGRIGRPRAIQGTFGYMNVNPDDIRNRADIGGGALYDIGCYPVVLSRFLFGAEPTRAVALIERDPDFATDSLASVLLDFPGGQAAFVAATQMVRAQRFTVFGSEGWIDVDIPYTPTPDDACRILIGGPKLLGAAAADVETFEPVDQYGLQGEAFSRAIRTGTPLEFPLEDAVANMRVIDALYRSGESGGWETV
jgi:predicted dehydrogenase